MRKITVCLILMLRTAFTFGQTSAVTDSLLRELNKAKDDTNKVFLYIRIGQEYEDRLPEKAKAYYKSAGDLSQKINFPKGVIKYIFNYTYVLNNVDGDYETSVKLNLDAVELARKLKDSLLLAKSLFNTGTAYRMMTDYPSAIKYYEEGKVLFKKFGNAETEAIGNDILQNMYYQLHQYDKGIGYGVKAVAGLRNGKNSNALTVALTNLGLNYSSARKPELARKAYLDALSIAQKESDKYVEMSQYINLGDLEFEHGNTRQLHIYFGKALVLARELKANESIIMAMRGISLAYFSEKDYKTSKLYADSILHLSYAHNLRQEREKILVHLSNLAYAMQDVHTGNKYALQGNLLNDSILNENVAKETNAIEKRYQLAAKEDHIKKLEADKALQQLTIKQKSTLNYLLIAGALVLLVTGLFFMISYRQKQKLQKQRLSELETESQLAATEAVLKGEEQERTRLAKDLHDGLGGMLSGIKYSLNAIKGNLIMTPDNQLHFERSIDMLESSISEMRRVAHNMMPEALIKFGLDQALSDFCTQLNQSGALLIHYQSIGLQDREVEQTVSIVIYRITQELIHNAIKHASAQNIVVQLSLSDKLLSLTVEDDGHGFDSAELATSTGIGWKSIRNRVEFLKGKLDIQSDKERGTSVLIEIEL